jgi:hypothetical protein
MGKQGPYLGLIFFLIPGLSRPYLELILHGLSLSFLICVADKEDKEDKER